MKRNQILLAIVGFAAASTALGASFAGDTSTYTAGSRYIKLGLEDDATKGYKDKASINVVDETLKSNGNLNAKGKEVVNNNLTSFAKMDSTANNAAVKLIASNTIGKDGNGVVVAKLYRMTGLGWEMIPKMPDHSHLGRLSYAKVGSQDLYFGDWADVKSGAADNTAGTNYTVFYSGSDSAQGKMPTSGTAVYAVKGINNHVKQGTAILTGNLTADFGKKTVNGTLAKAGLSIAVNNAAINTTQASFSGAAKANNSVNGTAKGHFFGNQAAAIAGVADFGKNHAFNTAFGGTKK